MVEKQNQVFFRNVYTPPGVPFSELQAYSKESTCQCRRRKDLGSISGLERSPGVGNDNALQYSGLGNPMDRGAWWAAAHGTAKSRT